MNKFILIVFLILLSKNILAKNNLDQWKDSKKTYKDLIDEGFEIKAYDFNSISIDGGLTILLFITVLQKKIIFMNVKNIKL